MTQPNKRCSRRRRFNDLLKRAGWTHERCADIIGVHRVTVSRWACGQVQIPLSRLHHVQLRVELAEAELQLAHLVVE